MPWLNLREVDFNDTECEAEFEAARDRYKRFDEAWAGIVWLLARNPLPPGSFPSLQKDGISYYIYGFRGDAVAGIPDMWIFYEYDDATVWIHGINANNAITDEIDEDQQ